MYLNPRVHGSIPTKDKNSTSKWIGEDHEIIVLGAPKARAITKKKMFVFRKILFSKKIYGEELQE
jgi:hypothetical protein